jgi:hypothetical protein
MQVILHRPFILAAAPAVLAVFGGCANIRHQDYIKPGSLGAVPEDLPKLKIDRNASALSLSYDSSQARRYDRDDVLSAVENAWNSGKAAAAPAVPARIEIHGSVVDEIGWLWAISLLYFYPAWIVCGGPTYSASANVQVNIELKSGERLTGHGYGTCYAALWYPGDPSACAFDKAVAQAIRKASR